MGLDSNFETLRVMNIRQKLKTATQLARGVLIARHCDQRHWILAGRGIRVEKHQGEIYLGGLVGLGAEMGIAVIGASPAHKAVLRIGDHTHIQDRSHINCQCSITIGSHCAISWDVEILDTDIHGFLDDSGQLLPRTAGVIIEDRVWIGARAIILKGVTIGHDSVVAAGAVVTQSMPPYSLCGGNPARVIRTTRGWTP